MPGNTPPARRLASARQMFSKNQRSELPILDINSGASNAIFPLLALRPDSQIIPSDLSLDLLTLLTEALAAVKNAESCG